MTNDLARKTLKRRKLFLALHSPPFPALRSRALNALHSPPFPALRSRALNPATQSGEHCKLPQQVRVEPGRWTISAAFWAVRRGFGKWCLVVGPSVLLKHGARLSMWNDTFSTRSQNCSVIIVLAYTEHYRFSDYLSAHVATAQRAAESSLHSSHVPSGALFHCEYFIISDYSAE